MRSGYSEGWDQDYPAEFCYRAIELAANGRRGQAFLRELASVLDAMEPKRLIVQKLMDEAGEVCALGAICKARGIDIDDDMNPDGDEYGDHQYPLARRLGIARSLVAYIEHVNDDDDLYWRDETPEERWQRVRRGVEIMIVKEST